MVMVALQLWALLLVGSRAHSLRTSRSDAGQLEARGDGFEVAGAGDERVNGHYEPVDGRYDTYGGHPMYRMVDSSGQPNLKSGEIYNQGGTWIIRHEDIAGSLYVGEGETPDKATWAVGPAGTPPVPTVSLAAAEPAPAKAEPKEPQEEPKPSAEPAPAKEEPSPATVTEATTTATTTAAATEPLETEDLMGLGSFVGLRLLIFFLILALITCCLLGLCVVSRDDGDTYTCQIDHSFGHKLGMDFKWKDGGLTIVSIEDEETLAQHFNERHNDASSDPCHIEVGHVLIEVNGIRNDESKMRAELVRPKLLKLVFRRAPSEDRMEHSQEVPGSEISEPLEVDEFQTPDKRPSLSRGGSTGGSTQSQLDEIMAKRRAREDGDSANVGSMASRSNVVNDETAAALARQRAKEGQQAMGTIGSQATATSAVQPELAARLAKQRQNEEVLGGLSPKS